MTTNVNKLKKLGLFASIAVILVIAVIAMLSLADDKDVHEVGAGASETKLLSSNSVVAPMLTIPAYWILSEEIPKDEIENVKPKIKGTKDYVVRANSDLRFQNEKGYVFAGTTFNKMKNNDLLKQKDMTKGYLYPIFQSGIETSQSVNNSSASGVAIFNLDILEIENSENKLLNKVCKATVEQDGKIYNYVFGLGKEVYTVWAESKYADHEELLKIVETLEILPQTVDESSPFFKAFQESKRVNVLLMVVDKEITEKLVLASFDLKSKELDVISIPRDTFYQRRGYDDPAEKKISAAYMGNPLNTAYAVSNMMCGIPVNYYAVLEYEGVEKMVDAIGGVPMNIPSDMVYKDPMDTPPFKINIPAGKQILDGEKAVQFLRYRSGYFEEDIGRVEAQQKFIESAIKQCLGGNLLEIGGTAVKNMETNLTTDGVKTFAAKAIDMKPENVGTHILPYTLMMEPPWYLYPKDSEVDKLLRELYGMKPSPIKEKNVTTSKGINTEGTTPGSWTTTPLQDIGDPSWITSTPLQDIGDPGWTTMSPMPDELSGR